MPRGLSGMNLGGTVLAVAAGRNTAGGGRRLVSGGRVRVSGAFVVLMLKGVKEAKLKCVGIREVNEVPNRQNLSSSCTYIKSLFKSSIMIQINDIFIIINNSRMAK